MPQEPLTRHEPLNIGETHYFQVGFHAQKPAIYVTSVEDNPTIHRLDMSAPQFIIHLMTAFDTTDEPTALTLPTMNLGRRVMGSDISRDDTHDEIVLPPLTPELIDTIITELVYFDIGRVTEKPEPGRRPKKPVFGQLTTDLLQNFSEEIDLPERVKHGLGAFFAIGYQGREAHLQDFMDEYVSPSDSRDMRRFLSACFWASMGDAYYQPFAAADYQTDLSKPIAFTVTANDGREIELTEYFDGREKAIEITKAKENFDGVDHLAFFCHGDIAVEGVSDARETTIRIVKSMTHEQAIKQFSTRVKTPSEQSFDIRELEDEYERPKKAIPHLWKTVGEKIIATVQGDGPYDPDIKILASLGVKQYKIGSDGVYEFLRYPTLEIFGPPDNLENHEGDVTITNVPGNIVIGNLKGDLDVQWYGNISFTSIDGNCTVIQGEKISGDYVGGNLNTHAESVSVETVFGHRNEV